MADGRLSAPLACSLGAGELREREEAIANVFAAHAVSARRTTGGARIGLEPAPSVQERMEALIAAERECCPFLELRLERGEQELVLEIAGPAEAQELVDSFESAARAAVSRR